MKNKSKFEKNQKNYLDNLKREYSENNVFFCMDLEFHELTKHLTEVGISKYNKALNEFTTYHFIVKEFEDLRNGKYVPDNKDNFDHGSSETLYLDEIEAAVLELLNDIDYLVGHDFKNDYAFLNQCGFNRNLLVGDTFKISQYLTKHKHGLSLEKLSNHLELDPKNLHNAGNDSFFTLKAYLKVLNS